MAQKQYTGPLIPRIRSADGFSHVSGESQNMVYHEGRKMAARVLDEMEQFGTSWASRQYETTDGTVIRTHASQAPGQQPMVYIEAVVAQPTHINEPPVEETRRVVEMDVPEYGAPGFYFTVDGRRLVLAPSGGGWSVTKPPDRCAMGSDVSAAYSPYSGNRFWVGAGADDIVLYDGHAERFYGHMGSDLGIPSFFDLFLGAVRSGDHIYVHTAEYRVDAILTYKVGVGSGERELVGTTSEPPAVWALKIEWDFSGDRGVARISSDLSDTYLSKYIDHEYSYFVIENHGAVFDKVHLVNEIEETAGYDVEPYIERQDWNTITHYDEPYFCIGPWPDFCDSVSGVDYYLWRVVGDKICYPSIWSSVITSNKFKKIRYVKYELSEGIAPLDLIRFQPTWAGAYEKKTLYYTAIDEWEPPTRVRRVWWDDVFRFYCVVFDAGIRSEELSRKPSYKTETLRKKTVSERYMTPGSPMAHFSFDLEHTRYDDRTYHFVAERGWHGPPWEPLATTEKVSAIAAVSDYTKIYVVDNVVDAVVISYYSGGAGETDGHNYPDDLHTILSDLTTHERDVLSVGDLFSVVETGAVYVTDLTYTANDYVFVRYNTTIDGETVKKAGAYSPGGGYTDLSGVEDIVNGSGFFPLASRF